jgi:drug/metabolite transporter (DMT)-like permease
VLGALFSSLAMMMLRRVGPRESAEAVAIHFSLTAAVVLTALALPHWVWLAWADLWPMLAAGVCAGFAQIAMTRAYALERAARVSGLSYLTVLVSATLGAIALNEWPPPLTLLGMALVVSGGLVITLAGMREMRGTAPPPS